MTFSFTIGCTNASKEIDIKSTDTIYNKEDTLINNKEEYTVVIFQKLQQYLHRDKLNPQNQDRIFSREKTTIKEVELIEPYIITSDSIKKIKTKVIFESETDTILTTIKTLEKDIDGECIKTNRFSFESLKKLKTISPINAVSKKPIHVERFSLRDLSFTWEDINACDCLYMVKAENTSYKKLYFGRFKGDTTGIIQLGKNTEKQLVPIIKSRAKNRKPGSTWNETYQNNLYTIKLKSKPTKRKVKGKHTYYIDFTLMDRSTKKMVKNTVLANCKS